MPKNNNTRSTVSEEKSHTSSNYRWVYTTYIEHSKRKSTAWKEGNKENPKLFNCQQKSQFHLWFEKHITFKTLFTYDSSKTRDGEREKLSFNQTQEFTPYTWCMYQKPLVGTLKLQTLPNPSYSTFFLIYTYW